MKEEDPRTFEDVAKALDRHMWNTRRESPTARGSRHQFESGGRELRTDFRERERPRRDELRHLMTSDDDESSEEDDDDGSEDQ